MHDDDALALVIDLRDEAMRDVAREVDAAMGGAFVPRVLPDAPSEPIARVVLLVDDVAPIVLPIDATDDARWLDALARLVRFAVLRGETVRDVASRYGEAYERAMVLPRWACGELDASARVSERVRRALG
ncbi:hypothetical protein [Sandaracinus amylolyticus]|uniref:Uncharacterized protein n=1 Tax=Sandaracinus amylolyticus TaxID=927083 RepID=A0A0F6YHK4_9BACT|nr:hypothetical protein [Sandaracinus amylolyticus]AKF04160.1 hypothetical protein DB32_001309 [Sandaracinus amylolyticus]